MIASLEPYPAMKDSGVPWLGGVPEHWGVLPGRACFAVKKVPNAGLVESQVLSLSYGRIVVKPSDKQHGLVPESYETYQIVDPGDIVVRPTDLQNDRTSLRFGFSVDRGIITSAYICLRAFGTLSERYGYLVLHGYDIKKVFYGLGSGLRQNLDWSDFKYLPIVTPPPLEQTAIVRFLDHADRKIQRLIRAKKKLIKLLEEQKQAIIHHAVTRGLDPNVRLKPSGVEWLGDAPEHWSLTPNRSLFRIRKALVGSRHTEYQLLSLTKKGIVVRDMTTGKGKFSDYWERSQEVRPGNLVFCLFDVDETPRTVGLSRHLGMISGDYTVMECTDEFNAPFLEYFYKAMDDRKLLSPLYTGLRKRISKPLLLAAKTPIPLPSEQTVIVDFLDRATADIDSAIPRAEREIELLSEFRTRLIADVVTGKLDTREAAADLPDERKADFVADEMDEMIEDNEVLEELASNLDAEEADA